MQNLQSYLRVSFPFSVIAARQIGSENGHHVAVQSSKANNLGKISLSTLACLQDLVFVSLLTVKASCPILHNKCPKKLCYKEGKGLS